MYLHLKNILIAMAAGLLVSACAALPKQSTYPVRQIPLADGPEDIILDDFGVNKRLIISCNDHRCEQNCKNGEILTYDLKSGKVDTLKRFEEPHGMVFHPHGIDLAQISERLSLYVVNHDNDKNLHYIIQYQVLPEGLYFQQFIESPDLHSPNAVAVNEDGAVYVSNDHYTRGKMSELVFKKPVCTVVRINPDKKADIVADHVQYGNGITIKNGFVYQAATRANAIYRYRIVPEGLVERSVVAKVVGPDNLRWDGDDLLVACHLRSFAFLRHAKNGNKRSPSVIYRVPSAGGEPTVVYSDKGGNISASSTALKVGNKLYVSQVFQPFILEVDLSQ